VAFNVLAAERTSIDGFNSALSSLLALLRPLLRLLGESIPPDDLTPVLDESSDAEKDFLTLGKSLLKFELFVIFETFLIAVRTSIVAFELSAFPRELCVELKLMTNSKF
jgi:hypothetical protein